MPEEIIRPEATFISALIAQSGNRKRRIPCLANMGSEFEYCAEVMVVVVCEFSRGTLRTLSSG